MSRIWRKTLLVLAALVLLLACNLPSTMTPAPATDTSVATPPLTTISSPTPTQTQAVVHLTFPASPVSLGKLNYDVESSGTAPEKRAPYGDAYDLNLLERPFQQDMSYLADMDIRTFRLTRDDTWYYLSIEIIGTNPNNPLGIHYGVELDNNKDGFGDFLIWASPPYTQDWSATNVQVFADTNRDTAGSSPTKSDAPFSANGYDALIFDNQQGIGTDADLAWVRVAAPNVVQFAFKQNWAGAQFLFSALSDAGVHDPAQMDYVDHFTLENAGSPIRGNVQYPLKALFLIDTTCRAAFGFAPSGYEPKLCPLPVPPTQVASTKAPAPQPTPTPTIYIIP